MPALAELEAAWLDARDDPAFRAELDAAAARLRRAPVAAVPRAAAERGRRAPDLPQARGPQPHRRAQDQQRARPGAARQADGQAADHRRDRRRPARRRVGDRVRAARPRVRRLHGHRGHAPPEAERRADGAARRARRARRGRRADAEGGGLRGDPRLGHERRDDALHHRLVRRPGAVPGARARPAAGDRRRGTRPGARARRTAARARDRVRRRRLERDRDLHPVRRRRRRRADRRRGGGGGDRDRPPRRAADRRRPAAASCTARTRRSCRTRTARSSRRTRSPPGSTTRAPGPSTRGCATPAGHATSRSPTRRRSTAFARTARLEGIIPALESSHALAWALAHGPSELDLVCLSGRGDKDLAEVLARWTAGADSIGSFAGAKRPGNRA